MKIVVVGLNHTTAPIELREQLSFDRPQANQALEQLRYSIDLIIGTDTYFTFCFMPSFTAEAV